MAVSRPYACPTCLESFTKYLLCQTHIRNSGPCRDALGDKINDQDALQDLCRLAASSGAVGVQASTAHPGIVASPSMPSGPQLQGGIPEQESDLTQQISPIARKKLKKAEQNGYLTEPEYAELEDRFDDLAEYTFAVQEAAVEKFLALGPGDLRWVVDKGAWLIRCLKFCGSASSQNFVPGSSPKALLTSALAAHALLPDALTQECWKRFLDLGVEEQGSLITAVRCSFAANASSRFSDHFLNLCANEVFIFNLEASPPPRMKLTPPPMGWESIEGTLYHRLLQLLLFRRRNFEEQLFKELSEADPNMQPGVPGSLLHTHLATTKARQGGSAEVLALLHAGAVNGLTRACARFIIEGLDVNERTGLQNVTPLHVAASHGEVGVIQLLLQHGADPNIRDADGHTPLYVAVNTAVQLSQNDRESASVAVTNQNLQMKCCDALLHGGAENVEEGTWSPEALAEHHQLHNLRNIIRLHVRLARLKHKISDAQAFAELKKLQFETANFAIAVFEKHILRLTTNQTAEPELHALISSDFIQERDKIQKLANRFAKRMGIGKKTIDHLVNLPPEVARYVLENFKLQETVPGVFEIPDHLNVQECDSAEPVPPPLASLPVDEEISNDQANESEAKVMTSEQPPKLEGRLRKWDSERGFGFIVQDLQPGEDIQKDIFVHRTNVVGSSAANPINLRENSRISYRLGEHDGRLRALDATMIDSQSQPLGIHSGICSDSDPTKMKYAGEASDNDSDEEDAISSKLTRFIRSRAVQELAKEKRSDFDQWLRCVGIRKHNHAHRDETVWKKEIDTRINLLVDKRTTPLVRKDFDFRVKRFLHEFCVHSNVTRASELLALVEVSTVGKSRDDVRSWPAYLATLLRKFDPKLYESLADRDRRTRIDLRKQRAVGGASTIGSEIDADAILENEEDQEQLLLDNADKHSDSEPPNYSPRSSEAASTIQSTDPENLSPRETTVVYQAPVDDLDPLAGPGANLFRYSGTTGAATTMARSFQ